MDNNNLPRRQIFQEIYIGIMSAGGGHGLHPLFLRLFVHAAARGVRRVLLDLRAPAHHGTGEKKKSGSCLKTGQHSIFVIIYLLLTIKCIIFDTVSKILFFFYCQ